LARTQRSDGHALLLSARELNGRQLAFVFQPDDLQEFFRLGD
jgi:hypothetical protein